MPDINRADDAEDGVDALARLRAADPMPPDEVAALSTSARARALRAEIVMQTESSHDTQPTVHPAPRWQRPLLAGLAVTLIAVAGTLTALQLMGDEPPPGDVVADGRVDPGLAGDDMPSDTGDSAADEELVDPIPGGGLGLCAVVYNPETLVERDVVFVGTVLSIDGDVIGFEVEEVLAGDPGDQVQLGGGEFLTTPNPDNVNPIAVGDRLLVAGDGGFAWGCGFTHPYNEDVAAEWRAAFAS